jgi:ATP-dependent protease ClpP protease subunit
MPEKIAALDAQIRLFGSLDDDMFKAFSEQLQKARSESQPQQRIVLSLSTTGGDAETARRIAEDVRLCRETEGRLLSFVGMSFVYSAGITVMAAFPRQERYLTKGTELLIHERRLDKTVQLCGGLGVSETLLQNELAAVRSGQRLEAEGFADLVAGTSMTAQEVLDKIRAADWYVTAEEALRIGLVKAIF